MDYLSLRKEVIDARLLERQYGYYAFKVALTIGMLALSLFILLKANSFWLQLLNAVPLAFVFVQFGLLMHDASHQQIFNSSWKNRMVGLFTGNLVTGMSVGSWSINHNRHHSSPNDLDDDPDVRIPFLAYSESQIRQKKGVSRLMARYQAFYWLPLMAISAISVKMNHQMNAVRMLFKRQNAAYYLLEVVLMAISWTAYFGILFWLMGPLKAFVFFGVHYLFTGLYMGTIFATNHKGMPLLNGKERPDFLRMQVLTARNVKGSLLVDFWTGGLDYQIEHHLFPTMPRNNLSKAKKIVETFCKNAGVDYYETGFFHSYVEILRHFRAVSAVLRQPEASQSAVLPASET